MVTFNPDKKFLSNNSFPCVLVFDTDLQGAWEFGHKEDIKWGFPRVYPLYREVCMEKYKTAPGSSLLIEDSEYKIGLLFTKRNRNEQSKEDMTKNFINSVVDLFRKLPDDAWIYSPILGREDKMFPSYLVELRRLTKLYNHHWHIYTKGE